MRRIGEWTARGAQWLAMAALAAMILHLGFDIVLRNFAGRPLDGTLEIVAELYLPFVAFGALAATHLRREEIRVDLIAQFIAPGATRALDLIAQAATVLCAAAMAWLTCGHALHDIDIGTRIEAGTVVIPAWPGRVIVALGFALLALAALARLLQEADDDTV